MAHVNPAGPERPEAAGPVGRPRTFAVGIFALLFGLTTLLALAVISESESGWAYALLVLPVAFAALVARNLLASRRRPDELA
jgi:hypothetical protein